MQKMVERGKAPNGVDRVDVGKIFGEKSHVHFTDGSALNIDGTIKHGVPNINNSISKWLTSNGWKIFPD